MKKYFYLLMMAVCMGFVSCGDDGGKDGKGDDEAQAPTEKNADLAGWWIDSEGPCASSLSPNKACWGLHFLEGNVFELAVLVVKESSYDSSYSTEDVGKLAFTYNSVEYYYSKQNSVKSYLFERNENTLYVKNVSYDPYIFIIMNGKMRWTDVEYVKTGIK